MEATKVPSSTEFAKLLTAKQAAAILNVSPQMMYKLAREKSIPGVVRIGTSLRFSQPHIEKWIERNTSK